MSDWSDYKIKEITSLDKQYPQKLLDLSKAPENLYLKGNFTQEIFSNTLAVVGSRKMTSYGKQVLDKILPPIIQQNITIISGFMYGVDTYAHNLALDHGGKTIAVLGSGLNTCYPVENDKMYTKILKTGGAVISEYEPQAKPKPWMYVQRNRIIASLATVGVLVVEAAESSGSLVTAKYAEELSRSIFAVPGQITSSVSAGTNYLIKSGTAKLVTSAQDILPSLKPEVQKESLDLTQEEKVVLDLLKNESLTIDELSIKLVINAQQIGTTLTLLSMKGIVKDFGGKFTLQ